VTHPSKRKGNDFEREIVNLARAYGLEAERAYASNGRALGQSENVDAVISGLRVQCKRRRDIPDYLRIPVGADAVVFRRDRDDSLAIVTYAKLMDLLKAESRLAELGPSPPTG